MNTDETISTFTKFFRDRGHQPIKSSSLLSPPGDPVLFTSAGMHPLTPYLTGQPHPLGRRLTGVQRCLRTTDLDEVGDPSHLTVFQMLGSWSLGDYGGPQSLRWGLELLCDGLGLRRELLHATVFGGDEQVGPDTVAQQTWSELGLPVELLGLEDNWWSNGPTGPCGPDSEIHVWTGDGPPSGSPGTDDRWLELWNTGRGYVLRRLLRRALTELWRGGDGSSLSPADLPTDLIQHTTDRFGQVIKSSLVTDVLAEEERKFRGLVSRGRSLLWRLYPSGRLTEQDYEFLRDTHGLPRELITDLLGHG